MGRERTRRLRLSLTAQMLAALLLGAAFGWNWPDAGASLQVLAAILIIYFPRG